MTQKSNSYEKMWQELLSSNEKEANYPMEARILFKLIGYAIET